MQSKSEKTIHARVLESLEDGVAAVDGAGLVTVFNPAAQSLFGLSERQGIGRPCEALLAGQDDLLGLLRMARRSGRSVSNRENIFIHRPGSSPRPVSVSVSPLLSDAGLQEGVVMILRDLSRVQELEEAVARADRLSMLGTLAAGLAHEIKNPLGGIKGAAQLLEMELAERSTLHEYFRVMLREIDRVDRLIEELMDLARPRPPRWSLVNLAKILGDIVLLQREAQYGKEIHFILTLDPSIPPVRGDEDLLARLFLNLVKNAAEAIDGKGRVEIVTKVASELHLSRPGQRPVPLVTVEIRDTGRGIPRQEIEKLFTPFYTTKSRGSGLGLATCQKIVNEHSGFLRVDSAPGEGTSFAVSLPFLTDVDVSN